MHSIFWVLTSALLMTECIRTYAPIPTAEKAESLQGYE